MREARTDEWEAIGQLTLEGYESAGILGTDPGYRAQLLDAGERAVSSVLLVAEDIATGDLLGTVTFCPHGSPHAEISGADEAEFRMLAVASSAHGRGAGRRLVEACVNHARVRGCQRLVLSVIEHNDNAASMYAHLGFTAAPSRDWEPAPGTHLCVWELPL